MKKESFLLELQVLKEIAEILNEGTDLYSTLNCALAKLVQVTGLDTGWIFLIDKNGDFSAIKIGEYLNLLTPSNNKWHVLKINIKYILISL